MSNPNSNMNLRRFDLNLLPILKALLATHSVARASEILGLSQSATSGALTRLRAMFNDPILVMVGRNLIPTPFANELAPLLDTSFSDLYALFDRRHFVPSEENRCFTISTSDYAVDEIGLKLLNILEADAPLASIKFFGISATSRLSMIGGDIDFMITPQHIITDGSDDFQSTPLWEDEMVVISSRSFPMPPGGLDLDTYLAANHAAYGVSEHISFEQWVLQERGLKRRNVITIPQFAQLPRYVTGSDRLATLPRQVALRHLDPFDLNIWAVPFDMPSIKISVHWSHVFDNSPAHRWFREAIIRAWRGQD